MTIIVHAALEQPDNPWGGIGVAVELQAAASAIAGYATVIITAGQRAEHNIRFDGLEIITVPYAADDGQNIYKSHDRVALGEQVSVHIFEVLERICRKNDVVLFIHNEELALLCEMAASASWVSLNAVVNHGLFALEHPSDTKLALLQARLLESADVVYAVSSYQVNTIREYYPKLSNVQKLILPLELLIVYAEEQGAIRKLNRVNKHLVLAAGRSVRQKGFDILIGAIDLFPNDVNVDVRITLGHGDYEYECECRKLAETICHPIQINSWMSRLELLRVMSEAAVVVVPSRFEPLGIVAAEAMAVGVPVVASETGGLIELLSKDKDSRLVCVRGEKGPVVESLVDALVVSLAEAPRVSMGSGILKNRYSVEKYLSTFSAHLTH